MHSWSSATFRMSACVFFSHASLTTDATRDPIVGVHCGARVLVGWLQSGLRRLDDPSVAPRPVAFGIWMVIYTFLLYHCAVGDAHLVPSAFLATSLFLTVLWAIAISSLKVSLAAIVLISSTVSAWMAVRTFDSQSTQGVRIVRRVAERRVDPRRRASAPVTRPARDPRRHQRFAGAQLPLDAFSCGDRVGHLPPTDLEPMAPIDSRIRVRRMEGRMTRDASG